jgi:hypothetical protein
VGLFLLRQRFANKTIGCFGGIVEGHQWLDITAPQ